MSDEFGFTDVIEYTQLRTRAINLLDRCLTEGDDRQLLSFVEEQIVHEPPRITLLRELADDLQLRLLSLKEHRFDVRDRIVNLFRDYGVDVTGVAPPDALDRYHTLTAADLMGCVGRSQATLAAQDAMLLRKAVEASLITTAQLTADIELTARLHRYVVDWLRGLNAVEARRRKPDEPVAAGYMQ